MLMISSNSDVLEVKLRFEVPHMFLDAWSPSNITVLGDAIHNMTPLAGVGANTAFRDAELLSGLLARSNMEGTRACDAIGEYENKMRAYANTAVSLSNRNAVSASSGRPFQRWIFRTLLKAAQASPFVMRGTIGKPVVENYQR